MRGVEDLDRIEKIEAVLFKVCYPLLVVPFKLHYGFYILFVYKNKSESLADDCEFAARIVLTGPGTHKSEFTNNGLPVHKFWIPVHELQDATN